MYKGFKIRIYPTEEQEDLIWKHIHGCRFIWNEMLAIQINRYKNKEKILSGFDMVNLLSDLKEEEPWLKDISRSSMATICLDLDKAYKRFFNGLKKGNRNIRPPKFKSRKTAKLSYPVCNCRFYFVDDSTVKIQCLKKVKFKSDLKFPTGKGYKFLDIHISYDSGKWMLSFTVECENQAPSEELNDYSIGIDLGVRRLATIAFNGGRRREKGFKIRMYHNINKSKYVKYLNKKLKHTQRTISRKYEASRKRTGKYTKTKNIDREEEKLRKLYARISNIRHNYIHKTTSWIVTHYLPKRVVMEDLNISGMMKNKHRARDIGEMNWHEFIRQMRYKCEELGIEFIQADRFYPSSKTCCMCGSINRDLGSKNVYQCPNCRMSMDRDFNAAINLSEYKVHM